MIVQTIKVNDCTPQTIVIGRRGTYDTMQIAFDLSYLVESYGNGVAVLAVKRSQDSSAYPAVTSQEDDLLLWTVSETDTFYVGAGEAQLMWYVDGGLAKTIIYPMAVMKDILMTSEEAPDAYQEWVDALIAEGAETLQNAQDAAQSASDAEQAKDDAVTAKEAAEEAQEAAETAVTHYPKIENNYWMVWDSATQQYVSTGIQAEGEDGYSPEVTIESITGGHRVTIIDKDHPQGQSFDVMNGDSNDIEVNDLVKRNSANVLLSFGNFNDNPSGNLGWTWDESHTTCTYSYTGQSPYVVPRIYNGSTSLPDVLTPGETYQFKFSSTRDDLYLEVMYYANGTVIGNQAVYGDRAITIPDTCDGLVIEVSTPTWAFQGSITVALVNAPSNADLADEITEANSVIDSMQQNVFQHVSHDSTFGILDIPVNRYTSFVVPTDTFSDAPDDLQDGGYAIFRGQAYHTTGISIVWLYGLTHPTDIWFATYNVYRSPALSNWSKIATNINMDVIDDALCSGEFAIDASNIEQGWWNWGSKSPSNTRIRTNRLIKVRPGTVVNYTVNSAFDIYIGIAPSVGATEWTQYLYWKQGDGTEQQFLVNVDGYLGIIFMKHDGSEIAPSDYNSIISISNPALFPDLDKMTCKIFRRVVCCGDSYTAGYIRTTEQAGTPSVMTHEEYAWPHYMSTLTGNAWKNCGSSGATTISWQTEPRGLPQAQAFGKAQAYVIGLMINDVGNNIDVGTSADIGTEANTYYAHMSKIIRELHTINPDAIIFVNTCPRSDSSFAPYNQAVRDIAAAYYSTYHTHCVDLYNYRYLYTNISLTGDSLNGHFTASGYEQFAEIYAYILSDYINTHISDFQNVHKIPFDQDRDVTNVYDSLTNSGEYTISSADLESGQWSWSQKDDNAARARTKFLIPVYAGMSIAYQNTTFDTYFGVLPTPTSMTYLPGLSGWKTDSSGVFNITADGYLTFVIRNHADTTAVVDPANFDSVVTIRTVQKNAIEQKQDATSYVTLSGTIVTQTGADNTMYLCGELAELTFIAPATGQTAIRFTSGTTPTVATFSGVTWLNGFDPSALEASKTYEINILNGLGCAAWT